jgi:hypothetical protein
MIYIDSNSHLSLDILKTLPKVSLEVVSGFAFHSFMDNCETPVLTLSLQNAVGLRTGDVVFIPLPKPRIGALRVSIVLGSVAKGYYLHNKEMLS